jgi:phosphohistidine phosphatase
MQLYLIRHADAEPVGSPGVETDEQRPLTAKGIEQVQQLASFFRRLAVTPGLILTSPLTRARQTAERLAEGLRLESGLVVEEPELAPGGSTKKLARRLARRSAETVFVVGHEPDLGRHTGWLIGSKRATIEFAKAGVACVDLANPIEKGCGTLRWLVTPSLLP